MVKEYKPQPFEERKSETLGVGDWAKRIGFYAGLPIGGAAVGYFAGKFGKNKLPYFNGQPPLIHRAYEEGAKRAFGRATGSEIKITNRERFPWLYEKFSDARAEAISQNIWNILKGFVPPTIVTAYYVWQEKESKRLDLVESGEDIEQVYAMHRTNASLKEENASLRKQVDYERQKKGEEPLFGNEYPTARVASVDHQDKVEVASLERQV